MNVLGSYRPAVIVGGANLSAPVALTVAGGLTNVLSGSVNVPAISRGWLCLLSYVLQAQQASGAGATTLKISVAMNQGALPVMLWEQDGNVPGGWYQSFSGEQSLWLPGSLPLSFNLKCAAVQQPLNILNAGLLGHLATFVQITLVPFDG